MKLQKFMESYRGKALQTPSSRSPDRPYLFKTSESIGTLNSRDEFVTDRSFVVKEQSTTRAAYQNLQHLKELCVSERVNNESLIRDMGMKQSKEGLECGRAAYRPIRVLEFNKINEQNENEESVAFPRAKDNSLFKNLRDSVSFEANMDGLYQQAPSSIEQMEHIQVCCQNQEVVLENETQWFEQSYTALLARVGELERENILLEQRLLSVQGQQLVMEQKENELNAQVTELRQYVGGVIQQNIEVQNKIKQLLLRQEMQRMRFLSGAGGLSARLEGVSGKSQYKMRR